MANANWSNPTLTSTYTNFVSEVKNRDEDLALQFDGTTSTNLVTNTIRWDSSAGRWKKWNGSSWAELASTYALTSVSTTGTFSSAAGTAAAPSITFTGDLNTGIYSPGADQLAISTGGTGRLFVDASGRVGVGTSSPGKTLDVVGQLRIQGSAASGYALLEYGSSSTASNNWHVGSEGDGSFRFYNGVFGAGTERLRVTSAGLVGIGTSSPSSLLHLAHATVADLRFTVGGTLYGNIYASSSDTNIYSVQATPLIFGTSNSERLRITSAGNVGIGTSSPNATLEVYGSARIGANNTTAFPASSAAGGCHFSWNRSSGSAETNICNLYEGATRSFEFSQKSGASTANVLYQIGSNDHVWFTSNTERARIDSSGRLLVGTSSTLAVAGGSRQLQIEGTSTGQSLVTHGGTNAGSASVFVLGRSRATSNGGVTAVAQDDTLGYIQFAGANGTDLSNVAAQITAAVDGAVSGGGVGDMPGRLVFSTTADGASSPTERLRIANNGQLSAVVPGNSTLYPGFMARAWVNFNGGGTVAIRGSGNVSSITDNGVGDYTVNFTTAMPDVNYALAGTTSAGTGTAPVGAVYATGSLRIDTVNASGTNIDPNTVNVVIFR